MNETPGDTKSPRVTRMKLADHNGMAIAAFREKDGFSQNRFAKSIGLAQSSLSAIESEQSHPTLSTLNQIARGLGIAPGAILRSNVPWTEDGEADEDAPEPAGVAA